MAPVAFADASVVGIASVREYVADWPAGRTAATPQSLLSAAWVWSWLASGVRIVSMPGAPGPKALTTSL